MAGDYSEEVRNRFSEQLRVERARRRLSAKEVCEATGLKWSTLHSYETGRRMPSVGVAAMLADYYGVSLDELVGR